MRIKNPLPFPYLTLVALASLASAGEFRAVQGVSYYPANRTIDDPEERCVVDLRLPEAKEGFATLVWFHGGGFTGGKRDFPEYEGEGIAFVSAGYRLSPQVPCPVFIEDAAAAVAWTLKHIASYGGDPKKVFVGGHSAGATLTLLVGMDPAYLKPYSLAPQDIAGLLPVSAQVTTHYNIKKMLGIPGHELVPVIDEYAPLHFVSKDLPPICLITGERQLDKPCRVEENDFMASTLRNLGHPDVEFHELMGMNHNSVKSGAASVMPGFIERVSKDIDAARSRQPE